MRRSLTPESVKVTNAYVTALVGDPVEHSISDIMFKEFAYTHGINPYLHLKIKVPKNKPKLFEYCIKGMIGLGLLGANITLPYKEKILSLVDEIDDIAYKMGAVNTIKVCGDKLIGYNTDGIGALKALETEGRQITSEDKVVIFGAGGAARAIAFSFYPITKNIIIINRTYERGLRLANDLIKYYGEGVRVIKLSEFMKRKDEALNILLEADIIVNATSVGMYPSVKENILPDSLLSKIEKLNCIAFDVIYNPIETNFLRTLKHKGCLIINGLGMMLWQGASAFELWTGVKVKSSTVEEVKIKLEDLLGRCSK